MVFIVLPNLVAHDGALSLGLCIPRAVASVVTAAVSSTALALVTTAAILVCPPLFVGVGVRVFVVSIYVVAVLPIS